MTEILQVYKCDLCGNIVEVVHTAGGALVCCGQPMQLMRENTTDGAKEKHVPVVESIDGGFKIKVGSVPHPMEAAHYIEWIELIVGDKAYRKFLKPGETPEAEFKIDVPAGAQITVREYCNLHGLWKA